MKKMIALLGLASSALFAQQPIEITYDAVNREFQAQLQPLLQNFVSAQESQGNQVVVSFYDNLGEVRTTASSASCPSYLQAISNYKVNFMRSRQLTSTGGVFYFGVSPGSYTP